MPGADWAALDLREHGYARHDVTDTVTHAVGREIEVAIYAIPEGAHHDPGPDHPVALSYIDVVVQGFLAEFGLDGRAALLRDHRAAGTCRSSTTARRRSTPAPRA